MRTQPDLVAAFTVLEAAVDSSAARQLRTVPRVIDGPVGTGLGPSRFVIAAAVGSGLMVATSWQTAAAPWPRPGPPWLAEFAVYYVGLATLTTAWLLMGRQLLDASVPVQVVRRFAVAGAAPLALAAPFGRDLWAYAAQGHLVGTGLSPYDHGPGDAPGVYADQVSAHWLFSPSPYGPLWLRMSQLAVRASHGHLVVAALLLRMPAFLGLALCIWAVPVLAERAGVRPGGAAVALWLGAASPLMLVLGVGGGHNDLLMLGLALAGVAVATRPGLLPLTLGAAIATLGVLIKSPAAIAVAFTVPASLVAGTRPTPRRVLMSCLAAAAGCAATLVGVTAASGLGVGWVRRTTSYAGWVNILSLPSGLTMLGKALTGDGTVRATDGTLRTARTVGEVVTVVLLVALWVLAVKRPARTLGCLATAFGASAWLAPSVQPWYYLWGLVLAGLVVRRRGAVLVLAVVGLVFAIMLLPSGTDLDNHWAAVPVFIAAIGLVRLILCRGRRSRSGW